MLRFYSTNGKSPVATLAEAVLRGLAEDGGLYMPVELPALPSALLSRMGTLSFQEIAHEVLQVLLGDEIPPTPLETIVKEAFNFSVPLVKLSENTHVLELFHGPTLSFKDFGARFTARLMSFLARGLDRERTVLVATSGDTGSAVASGFSRVSGIRVVILYPSGQVSPVQEKQLTTNGQNIAVVELEGSFDDCQRLVKMSFGDRELRTQRLLTSANSINVARLLPQSLYYMHGFARLSKRNGKVIFSVPSGNFGNLTAGVMAKRMGIPIKKFIAATNVNDVVPRYLETGDFTPRPSMRTVSNAMDVGNPSNFPRLEELCGHDHQRMREDIWGSSHSDLQTERAIQRAYEAHGYLFDPHGAVGLLGLEEYAGKQAEPFSGIVLGTAHPAKFPFIVERATKAKLATPQQLSEALAKKKEATRLPNDFQQLREFLLSLRN